MKAILIKASLFGVLLTSTSYAQDSGQQAMAGGAKANNMHNNTEIHNKIEHKAHNASISAQEVIEAQNKWAEGIVEIGKVFKEGGDYKARAKEHIDNLYAYGIYPVLFKPTLASDDQFRETFDQALSYFVGGEIAEDKGFAIKPWSKVRFGERQIVMSADTAIVIGNYFFTPVEIDEEVKVEYTFGYRKDDQGNVRINVHHSSLPFSSE